MHTNVREVLTLANSTVNKLSYKDVEFEHNTDLKYQEKTTTLTKVRQTKLRSDTGDR